MRTFVIKAGLFVALQLAIIAWVLSPYQPNPELFWASTVLKHQHLAHAPSPRLVFIGGSNLAFGLDSERLAEALPFTPVNMGIDVGLGLDFMLRETAPHLRAGDVVVVSPEYELFLGFRGGQSSSLARVIEQRPGAVGDLSWRNVATLMDTGVGFFHWLFVNADRGLHQQVLYGPYSLSAFNLYGDAVAHLDHPSRAPALGRAMERFERAPIDGSAIRLLNRFHQFCRERGVTVFLTHPPLPSYYGERESQVRLVERDAHPRLTVPELERADEAFFPADQFYDTEYHLLRGAREQRTRLIIDRLHQRLGSRLSTRR